MRLIPLVIRRAAYGRQAWPNVSPLTAPSINNNKKWPTKNKQKKKKKKKKKELQRAAQKTW